MLFNTPLPDGFDELYVIALYTAVTGHTEPLVVALMVFTFRNLMKK